MTEPISQGESKPRQIVAEDKLTDLWEKDTDGSQNLHPFHFIFKSFAKLEEHDLISLKDAELTPNRIKLIRTPKRRLSPVNEPTCLCKRLS